MLLRLAVFVHASVACLFSPLARPLVSPCGPFSLRAPSFSASAVRCPFVGCGSLRALRHGCSTLVQVCLLVLVQVRVCVRVAASVRLQVLLLRILLVPCWPLFVLLQLRCLFGAGLLPVLVSLFPLFLPAFGLRVRRLRRSPYRKCMVLLVAAKKRDAAVLSVLRFLVLSLGVLFARHCLVVSSHFVPSGQCVLAALVAFSVLLFACFASPRRVSPVLVSVGLGCFAYACLSVSVSCVAGFVHMFLAWPAVGGMLFELSVHNFVSAFRASRMRAMRSASVFSRSWAPCIVENEVAASPPLPLALFVLSPAGVICQIPAQSTCLALFVVNSMTPAGFLLLAPRMTVSGHPFESSPTATPVDSVNVGTASWAPSVLPDRKRCALLVECLQRCVVEKPPC
ncbi:hypothetical protein, conserved in T. vivax [Trypanosoma vivax Y486]|uniref:Trypanosoma vivax n=1 Tax=Trypanosoma vivax (strain Y486) TaxID=1055687 RepID=F9WP62_TRYVY|nr:hypothetical protein, conserved in T. vivax [Trypanosoma vivax Y486]|eukprot:CCD19336.1 hypothetical protein, conserved in T. vivax [Trypanosoma vivax Y486]